MFVVRTRFDAVMPLRDLHDLADADFVASIVDQFSNPESRQLVLDAARFYCPQAFAKDAR